MKRFPRLSRLSRGLLAGTAVLAALASAAPARAGSNDAAMLALASHSGCMTCHHIDPGGKGPDGLPPVGPAWRDVSDKYAGQRGAEDRLTATVLGGSNPYLSHWKGQASGLAMPPNQVAISEADARRLVKWILALGPTK
ncbi:c-type cytochrome [Ideonella sp.]|uniref:c-type cytochrome n=1 Tax=Ideonella sp. TaxID=1929293 RepID=UPI002B45E18A|nr:c-type cytochrome [Ideonella sp.]HJV67828.1 c-type cytochrome [Ideonella sp.]